MDEEMLSPESSEDERSDKSVSSDLIRGHINTIILRALYDGDKYGYEIIAEIERKSCGQYSLKQPSLYSALKRLEKDGYITSYWGGSVGGGRRKYFSLTDEGKSIAEQNQAEWEYSRTIIDSLISDRDFDFSNPAPTVVNMRVLRSSTSRVPTREGEAEDGEEFVFDPAVDETALRDRLEQEYVARREELEREFSERKSELEDLYASKLSALERDRADFDAEKDRIVEELKIREETLSLEKSEEFERLRIAYEAELERLRNEKNEALEKIHEEQDEHFVRLVEEREVMLQLVQSEKDALERELEEVRTLQTLEGEALRNELELQKQKFIEETEAHAAALQAEREAHEAALREQREANEATLRVEQEVNEHKLREAIQAHEAALRTELETNGRLLSQQREAGELALQAQRDELEHILQEQRAESENEIIKRDRIIEEERRAIEELRIEKEQTTAALHAREEDLRLKEIQLRDDRARYDAQIAEDRARYEQALLEHEALIRREMEEQMAEREREIIHRNYLSLVDTPQPPPSEPNYSHYNPDPAHTAPAPEPEDYKSVVGRMYENSVHTTRSVETESSATPVSGIDFRDVRSRAAREGLRVTTAGGQVTPVAQPTPDYENIVHKGKALFLSAVVFFVFCVAVGSIALGLQKRLEIPVFFPYLMWGIGICVLLTTGLAYANHYGENWLRRPVLTLVNTIVIYALLVIITLIVSLSAMIDFGDISQVTTFVILPIVYFLGVVVFGVCYYLQIRPLKKTEE